MMLRVKHYSPSVILDPKVVVAERNPFSLNLTFDSIETKSSINKTKFLVL